MSYTQHTQQIRFFLQTRFRRFVWFEYEFSVGNSVSFHRAIANQAERRRVRFSAFLYSLRIRILTLSNIPRNTTYYKRQVWERKHVLNVLNVLNASPADSMSYEKSLALIMRLSAIFVTGSQLRLSHGFGVFGINKFPQVVTLGINLGTSAEKNFFSVLIPVV